MKVLEDGKNPRSWTTKIVCSGNGNGGQGCGAKLLAEFDDFRHFPRQEFQWRIAPEAVVCKCPQCGVLTDLTKDKWPPRMDLMRKFSSAWARGEREVVADVNRLL